MRPLSRVRLLALATLCFIAVIIIHALVWLPFRIQPEWVVWHSDTALTVLLLAGCIFAAGAGFMLVRRRGSLPSVAWVLIGVVAMYAAVLLAADMRYSGGRVPYLTTRSYVAELPDGKIEYINGARFLALRLSYQRATSALALALWVPALAILWTWGGAFALSHRARWSARGLCVAACLTMAWGLGGLLSSNGQTAGLALAMTAVIGAGAWGIQAVRTARPSPTRLGPSALDIA
jgi:hypothetical protein